MDIFFRYNVDKDNPLPDRMGTLHMLRGKLIESPADLVDSSAANFRNFAVDFRFPGRVLLLRNVARIGSEGTANQVVKVRISMRPTLWAQSIRGGDISDFDFSKHRDRNLSASGTPSWFADMGPSAKIRALSSGEPGRTCLEGPRDSGATLNVLRRAPDSLDSAASGVALYILL